MGVRNSRLGFSLLGHGICSVGERNDIVYRPDTCAAKLLEWGQREALRSGCCIPVRNYGDAEWRSNVVFRDERDEFADMHERDRPFGRSVNQYRNRYEQDDQLRGCDQARVCAGVSDEQSELDLCQPRAFIFCASVGAGDTDADEDIRRAKFIGLVSG